MSTGAPQQCGSNRFRIAAIRRFPLTNQRYVSTSILYYQIRTTQDCIYNEIDINFALAATPAPCVPATLPLQIASARSASALPHGRREDCRMNKRKKEVLPELSFYSGRLAARYVNVINKENLITLMTHIKEHTYFLCTLLLIFDVLSCFLL